MSDEDSYSIDDDFSASLGGLHELSSICEEPEGESLKAFIESSVPQEVEQTASYSSAINRDSVDGSQATPSSTCEVATEPNDALVLDALEKDAVAIDTVNDGHDTASSNNDSYSLDDDFESSAQQEIEQIALSSSVIAIYRDSANGDQATPSSNCEAVAKGGNEVMDSDNLDKAAVAVLIDTVKLASDGIHAAEPSAVHNSSFNESKDSYSMDGFVNTTQTQDDNIDKEAPANIHIPAEQYSPSQDAQVGYASVAVVGNDCSSEIQVNESDSNSLDNDFADRPRPQDEDEIKPDPENEEDHMTAAYNSADSVDCNLTKDFDKTQIGPANEEHVIARQKTDKRSENIIERSDGGETCVVQPHSTKENVGAAKSQDKGTKKSISQYWHNGKILQQPFEESTEDPKSKAGTDHVDAERVFYWESKEIELQRVMAARHKPKKPAPLPRCALLTTKSQAGTQKNQNENTEPKKKVVKYSNQRLSELSQPRLHHLYTKSGAELEKTHLKGVKPSKKNCSQVNDFLDRMESMERQRRDKLDHKAAEAQYDALPKLKCPKCGRQQSYNEMITKTMTCASDSCNKNKVTYQKTRAKLSDFLERLDRSTQRRHIKINEIKSERRSSMTSQTLQQSSRQKELINKVSKNGQDFMTRMEEDVNKRNNKMTHLEELMDESLSQTCTFKPTLNISNHLIRNRKGGLASLAVPARRYTQDFDERLEECEERQRRNNRRSVVESKKPIESLWGHSRASKKIDEDKMKKRFQKSYM
jgi:hypothetical protein